MRRAATALFLLIAAAPAHAQTAPCDPAAFREVVSAASASITALHENSNRIFQERLQKLRSMYGWTDAEYVAKATPFVKDETTASIDSTNQALLAKVQSLGSGDATAEAARCAMLTELKTLMRKVVENTDAKWQHMISKATMAANATMQAGAAH